MSLKDQANMVLEVLTGFPHRGLKIVVMNLDGLGPKLKMISNSDSVSLNLSPEKEGIRTRHVFVLMFYAEISSLLPLSIRSGTLAWISL